MIHILKTPHVGSCNVYMTFPLLQKSWASYGSMAMPQWKRSKQKLEAENSLDFLLIFLFG